MVQTGKFIKVLNHSFKQMKKIALTVSDLLNLWNRLYSVVQTGKFIKVLNRRFKQMKKNCADC